MTTYRHIEYPEYRVFIPDADPAAGEPQFFEFHAGYLDVPEEHPHRAVIDAEAARNPQIEVHEALRRCPVCGAFFEGRIAPAELGRHMKQQHPDYDAEAAAEASVVSGVLKAAATNVCTFCSPPQQFGSEEELERHNRAVHGSASPVAEVE